MYPDDTVRIPLRARDGSIRDYALVDAEDYPLIAGYTWSLNDSRGHHWAVGSVNGRVTSMHRVIMNAPPGMYVDHRNHNGLDNRRANLRLVTQAQNSQNRRGAASHSKTGVRGVRVTANGRYEAAIWRDRRAIWCQRFPTLEEAEVAVIAARRIFMPYSET